MTKGRAPLRVTPDIIAFHTARARRLRLRVRRKVMRGIWSALAGAVRRLFG